MVDSQIGPYKIVREIAEDRFGKLFQAVDPEHRKQVVIKLLRPAAAARPEVASRLYSEAATLALLNHPHIARIFGFARLQDRLYLVMEFVEGESLATILKEKHRLEPKVALAFFHQILPAVKYAHELGVVHGDLNPSNIMVSSFAQIKILNFAISALLGNLNLEERSDDNRTEYWSPEQITGDPIDARSDIYSLGVLLYRLIVGKLPFQSEPHDSVSGSGCGCFTPTPPSLLVPNCPDWLDAFMQRALAAKPSERFQSVSAMSSAMGIPIEVKAPTAPPRRARRGVKDNMTSSSYDPANARARRLPEPWALVSHREVGAWKERLHGIADNGWKRYAVLAILFASVMIETFIFGGTNTLLAPDYKPATASRIEVAEVPIEPADPTPVPASAQDNHAEIRQPDNASATDGKSKPQPKVVKRANRPPKTQENSSEKPAGRAGDLHLEALNVRRTVTYRSEPDNSRPVLQELRVVEPSPPRRNNENHTVRPQLNVKWEN